MAKQHRAQGMDIGIDTNTGVIVSVIEVVDEITMADIEVSIFTLYWWKEITDD